MQFNELGVAELAAQGATAGGLGMLGRLLALAHNTNRPSGWSLLWEVPTACGMGVVGKGIAEALGVGGFQHYAVVIAVAYTGPRIIDILIARYATAPPKKRTTKPEQESTTDKEPKAMKAFLKGRLNERSTVVKLIAALLLFFGPDLLPEQRETITTVVLMILGIGAAVPDGAVLPPKE